MKILLISDLPLGGTRGCEQNDKVIYDSIGCDFLTCAEFNEATPSGYDRYLLSNFASLSEESKEFLVKKEVYHLAHDFLFTPTRNVGNFEDFVVPPDFLINYEFFKSFKKIYTQSKLHQELFKKNGLESYSISGNLWSSFHLKFMEERSSNSKNGRCLVLNDPYKGTNLAANLGKQLNLLVDILPRMPYLAFLDTLGKYSAFLFQSPILETLNRVILEAKMMNTVPIIGSLCGCTSEKIFELNGKELIEELRRIRDNFLLELKL